MPTEVTFVAAGALSVNAMTASEDITAPACAANDILIAAVFNKSAAANVISPPDGSWTEVTPQGVVDSATASFDFRYSLWWKRATGSGGSFTFTKATDDNVLFGGVIVAYRGAKLTGSPLDLTPAIGDVDILAGDPVSFTNYDPTSPLVRAIFVAFYADDNTAFDAAMSSDTNPDCTIDVDVETATGTDFSIAITSGLNDGSVITGRTWNSNATSDAANAGFVFALVAQNDPPTVALNSPADAATDQTTTPTFDFTGTDADADPVEYQIQISPDAAWGVIDSYSESNVSVYSSIGSSSSDHGIGQSFTGNGAILMSALFYLKRDVPISGNAVATIYEHSGTFGTSSLPTGSALATSDSFDVSTLSLDPALITFTFSGVNQILLQNTVKYVLAIEYNSGATDAIRVAADNTSSTHGGNRAIKDSSDVWSSFTGDLCFYVRSALLDKLSTVDAGFINPDTGADLHPFNSGENIQYTVQSGEELIPTRTYWWRVRGFDPTGTQTWGAWSSTRTFGPEIILALQNLAVDSTTDASVDTSATTPESYNVNTQVIETPSTVAEITISSKTADGESPQQQAVIKSHGGVGTTVVGGGTEVSTRTEVTVADTSVGITGSDV